MSKSPKVAKADTAAQISGEITRLEQRSVDLNDRLDDAGKALFEAKITRKKALSADAKADLSAMTKNVRDFEDEIATIEGVIADLDEQLDDARARLSKAIAREQQEASAAVLREIASRLSEPAAAIDKAADAIAEAVSKIEALFPAGMAIAEFEGSRPADFNSTGNISSREIARAIAIEALAFRLPDAFSRIREGRAYLYSAPRLLQIDGNFPGWDDYGGDRPVDQSASDVSNLLVTRLEGRAAAILDGDASADLCDGSPWPMRVRHEHVPTPMPRPAAEPTVQKVNFSMGANR